jgi:hypothetical protein
MFTDYLIIVGSLPLFGLGLIAAIAVVGKIHNTIVDWELTKIASHYADEFSNY